MAHSDSDPDFVAGEAAMDSESDWNAAESDEDDQRGGRPRYTIPMGAHSVFAPESLPHCDSKPNGMHTMLALDSWSAAVTSCANLLPEQGFLQHKRGQAG